MDKSFPPLDAVSKQAVSEDLRNSTGQWVAALRRAGLGPTRPEHCPRAPRWTGPLCSCCLSALTQKYCLLVLRRLLGQRMGF